MELDSKTLGNYLKLSREDIRACLAYASETLKAEKEYYFPTVDR